MSRRLWIAGLVSLLLHLGVVVGLLTNARQPVASLEAPDKPAAIELVMEEQKGSGQTVLPAAPPAEQPKAAATPAPATASEAAPPPHPPAPPPPPEAETDAAAAAAPPKPESSPPATAASKAPPRPAQPSPSPGTLSINLGGTDSDSNALVTGDNVIPASPDKKARNRPPPYPEDAARNGQQGTVIVVIHVSVAGLTEGVDVLRSSGYPTLDRAARDAVMSWRFLPAIKDGAPIPFDMQMRFVFAFN